MAATISSRELLEAIKSGLTDAQLRERFQLNQKQLEKVFGKLVESGRLSQADLDLRESDEDFLEFPSPATPDPNASVRPVPDSGDVSPRRPDFLPPSGPGGNEPDLPANLDKHKRNAWLGILGGIVLQIVGGILSSLGRAGGGDTIFNALGIIIIITGLAAQTFGFYSLAKYKGYHWAFALLGLLSCCIGLIILLALPNKYKEGTEGKGSGAILAIAIVGGLLLLVAVTGIVAAVAIPYYVSYKRTACDRAASKDITMLSAAVQRLGHETADLGQVWDENTVNEIAEADALKYLVGPYYGWGGSTKKCGTCVRMTKENNKWIIEGVSLKGAHPQGVSSRYVYRIEAQTGKDVVTKIGQSIVDAGNGRSTDWNSYSSEGMCYSDTIIDKSAGAGTQFKIRAPKGRPCSEFKRESSQIPK
jgi:hypothetical protein